MKKRGKREREWRGRKNLEFRFEMGNLALLFEAKWSGRRWEVGKIS